MLQSFDPVKGGGLHLDQPDRRVKLLQPPPSAHQGASGADGGDQVGDPSPGLLPDLRGRMKVMRLRIGRVVVLVRFEVPAGLLLIDAPGLEDRPVRAFGGVGQDDSGTECPYDGQPLLARARRHHQLDRISVQPANPGVCDAGVPRCGVQDHLSPGQGPRGLAVQDHLKGRAVLDRAPGVEHLQLGE